jgi:prephenate dehydrogenase
LKSGVKDSDLVIIAAPVLKITEIAKAVIPFMKKGAILTDAGSTKRYVVNEIEKISREDVYFIGSHHIAGSEKSGIKFADGDLFKNTCCIITKTKNTDPDAMAVIRRFWSLLQMQVITMTPDAHDKLLSRISHLPHAVSVSIVNSIGRNGLKLAAGGFRDTTRIASGEPVLWKDIFFTNKDNLIKDIDVLKKELSKMQAALKNNDQACLLKILTRAKIIRDSL